MKIKDATFQAIGSTVAWLGLLFPLFALADSPSPIPELTSRAKVLGRWDRIPLPTRGSDVTRLLVAGPTLWVGTSNGLAYYDGDTVGLPKFAKPEDTTALIVNDLTALATGSVLVGTINGSLWRADRASLHKLLDLGRRSEFSFVRRSNGRLEIASSFGLRAPSEYDQARSAVATLGIDVSLRKEQLTRMTELDGRLYGVSPAGTLYELYDDDRAARAIADIKDAARHMTPLGKATIAIATYKGCYAVPVDDSVATVTLSAGFCPAVAVTPEGELWVARENGVFRYESGLWTQYFGSEAVEINPVGAFASDSQANLWVGGSNGLWRLYNQARPVALPDESGEIASVAEDRSRNLFVGFKNGSVLRIGTDRRATRVDLGDSLAASSYSPSDYYPGALLSQDAQGDVWVLNHNGLFRLQGDAAILEASYPFPREVRSKPVAAFAVRDRASIFAGRTWATEIYQLVSGQWQSVRNTSGDFGGSAVPAVTFDPKGRLWAVSSHQVHLLEGGKWRDFGPYEIAPDVKKNLYGVIVSDPRADGIIANGPWGYPVLIRKQSGEYVDQPLLSNTDAAQPYIFQRVIAHPSLGVIAATEKGLMRWEHDSNVWRPLTLVDPRLEAATKDLAAAAGRDLWLVANGVYQVSFPAGPPEVDVITAPAGVIHSRASEFAFRMHGFSGPPEKRQLQFQLTPAASGADDDSITTRTRFTLTSLADGSTYSYRARAVDAYGNSGPWVTGSFAVDLPWYENPVNLGAAVVAAMAALGIAVTRRGPTGFLLRVVGGRRWRLVTGEPDLEIEITQPHTDRLEFRLRAPAKQVTVEAYSQRALNEMNLEKLREAQGNVITALDQTQLTRETLYKISRSVRSLGSSVYDLLPDTVRLSYEQSRPAVIRLVLADSLMDLPWEIWGHGSDIPMAIGNAPARTILSDRLAHKAPAAGMKLTALLFAPSSDTDPSLPAAQNELERVSDRIKSWGARVNILPGDADKKRVLDALAKANLFHYAGHAHFNAEDPAQSYLPIVNGRIHAEDIHAALQNRQTPLYLAFINGCSSSRESMWRPGRNVFGLASAFLRDATYFVGAQWPVQDDFASEFADAFYAALFPSSQLLLWHWLRGRNLTGASLGDALRVARERLYRKTHESAATWPAYVCYGDPTARLTLS